MKKTAAVKISVLGFTQCSNTAKSAILLWETEIYEQEIIEESQYHPLSVCQTHCFDLIKSTNSGLEGSQQHIWYNMLREQENVTECNYLKP